MTPFKIVTVHAFSIKFQPGCRGCKHRNHGTHQPTNQPINQSTDIYALAIVGGGCYISVMRRLMWLC